jgi:hypothetical protein
MDSRTGHGTWRRAAAQIVKHTGSAMLPICSGPPGVLTGILLGVALPCAVLWRRCCRPRVTARLAASCVPQRLRHVQNQRSR